MMHEQDIRFLNAFERLFSPNELDTLGRQSGFMKQPGLLNKVVVAH